MQTRSRGSSTTSRATPASRVQPSKRQFADEHGRGGRALARKIIDGELTASTPQLAKGKGPAANGVYLYPAPETSSPLADPPDGEHGEQVSGQCLPLQLASSPPPFRGGRAASSEQPDIDEDEIERLAALALDDARGKPMNGRERLADVLAADVLAALDAFVDERIAAALSTAPASNGHAPRWVTLEDAADLAGCSPDAMRMRVSRGRYRSRRDGARVYVLRADVDPEPE